MCGCNSRQYPTLNYPDDYSREVRKEGSWLVGSPHTARRSGGMVFPPAHAAVAPAGSGLPASVLLLSQHDQCAGQWTGTLYRPPEFRAAPAHGNLYADALQHAVVHAWCRHHQTGTGASARPGAVAAGTRDAVDSRCGINSLGRAHINGHAGLDLDV